MLWRPLHYTCPPHLLRDFFCRAKRSAKYLIFLMGTLLVVWMKIIFLSKFSITKNVCYQFSTQLIYPRFMETLAVIWINDFFQSRHIFFCFFMCKCVIYSVCFEHYLENHWILCVDCTPVCQVIITIGLLQYDKGDTIRLFQINTNFIE